MKKPYVGHHIPNHVIYYGYGFHRWWKWNMKFRGAKRQRNMIIRHHWNKACEIASDIGYLVVVPDGPSNGRMLVPVINDAEDDFDVVYPENGGWMQQ